MQKIDWRILKKSVSEPLSSNEQLELDGWLNASEEHREYYRKLNIFFRQKGKEVIHVDRHFRNFQKQTNLRLHQILLRKWYYAAMIICLLGAGLLLYLKQPVSFPKASLSQIVSGSYKAILHTGDGKTYSLVGEGIEELPVIPGLHLNQQQNQINYAVADSMTGLATRHLLEVPHGGEFRISLCDGTEVFLNSESQLAYPAFFSGDERRITLSGEAYFQVVKSSKPFIIELNGMEIKVLGTEFNVRAYEDENSFQTTLVNGHVEVSSGHQKVDLLPGEQVLFDKKEVFIKRMVDVTKYIAWKDGYVAFEDERLEDIMSGLAKWYNIEVFYATPALKEIRFTGNINRYGEIRVLLEKIEKLDVVSFKIKGNCITIESK